MRTVTLTRAPSTSNGTLGDWLSDSGFKCKTVERSWLDDAPMISCISPGVYQCAWQWSNSHGKNLYHVLTNDGRTGIEVHSANVADQLLGCIAVGSDLAMFGKNTIKQGMPLQDCWGVINSVETLAALERDLRDPKTQEQLPFVLTVKWA